MHRPLELGTKANAEGSTKETVAAGRQHIRQTSEPACCTFALLALLASLLASPLLSCIHSTPLSLALHLWLSSMVMMFSSLMSRVATP